MERSHNATALHTHKDRKEVQTHSGDELDELDEDIEWHVLGLDSPLTPGEQHLQDVLQTAAKVGGGKKFEGRGWGMGGVKKVQQ